VGDVRNDVTRPDAEPMVYVSGRQFPWSSVSVLIRTSVDPLALVRRAEQELAALDSELALVRVRPLHTLVAAELAGRRLPTILMTAFGGLALLLASVGIYAMFAAMASAREREYTVRLALGSSRRGIAALVLREGAVWMAAGFAGGIVGVWAVTRTLRGLLYGVSQFDPVAHGIAIAMLLACAMIALVVPIGRATRADLTTILR
jgi:ABC-type antimicrobial peptide transport system permease subunit